MTSDSPTAIPVLAVRVGDTIFKDRKIKPLTVDEIDWVLEHEHGPVVRFIGVSEGNARRIWVCRLSGIIGCFDAPDDEALEEREPGAMIRTCGSREGAPSRKMIDEVTGF
ncbi:hypothetical protein IU468_26975 [Nocardia farcinica]|uniref:hypothetical protein n=1 Tax=Nocardia farcinica TaxID=37329 RepID=UPI0018933966|nr:hypothetical protein [Nocardia farcinica]MBF6259921.1 hypothetical protein [Nocardia farcinica]